MAHSLSPLLCFLLGFFVCFGLLLNQAASVSKKPARMNSLEAVTKEHVVPDVIDTVPKTVLTVEWLQAGVKAEMGKELTPTKVKDLPKISFNPKDFGDANREKLYTIVMVDPDAPSRKEPKFREILHYMIVNVPGNDLAKGQTLFHYVGAGAPKGTGLHRYIFLLYQQKDGKITSDTNVPNTSRDGRMKFSIRKFAKENNLGEPLAVNFFQAQYDDYVALLQAQLSG